MDAGNEAPFISSPSYSAPETNPIFYINNLNKGKVALVSDLKVQRGNQSVSTVQFTDDIVTLGKVSLELTKSSSGEKLILVGNSRLHSGERKRFSSLSQPGFPLNTSNTKNQFCPEITEQDIEIHHTSKKRWGVFDDKMTRQARVDRLNSIHDYFQQYDPQIKKRRRVQSK